MDEEIPYADDIPYEEQIPAAQEQEQEQEQVVATSLKERIGNRIYLLEDSRKRKLVDVETTVQAEEPDDDAEDADADLSHRPNALLLRGPPISQLPTARVFAYATHFDAHPIGLEWVDDETCVLVFASRKSALQAWDALRRPAHVGDPSAAMQLDDGGEEALSPALPLPLALYPIEERINSVLGTKKTVALKETLYVRWARSSDVKQRGARINSEFYKKHGETAGKEGAPGISQHKRRKHDEDETDTKRKLDADLDTFLDGGEEGPSTNLDARVGEKRRRPQHEETRRLLDDELDSFLAHGAKPETTAAESNPPVPSLVDRTTRPLPRRGRRGLDRAEARSETDGNGRWLHNAERRRRPRRAHDEEGSGMRAWGGEDDRRRSGGRSKKPRKTQEELDRELEEFLGE